MAQQLYDGGQHSVTHIADILGVRRSPIYGRRVIAGASDHHEVVIG